MAAVATLLNALAGALVFGGAVWLTGGWSPRVETALAGAVLAFPVTVISTFCNVALLRIAQARFDGRHCTTSDGFRAAWRRTPATLAWSLLAVGVGAVFNELAERVPFFGALAAWLLGVAWSLATMFAVPVLAIEDAGARRAARQSAHIFRERWGEGVVGTVSVTP